MLREHKGVGGLVSMEYQSQIKEWVSQQLPGAKGNLNILGTIIKWRNCTFHVLT